VNRDPYHTTTGWGMGRMWYSPMYCGGAELGRTNYLPVAGGYGKIGNEWDQWAGVFYNRSQTRMAEVSDGTSNTLLFGEYAGGYDYTGTILDISACWIGSSALFTAGGIRPRRPHNRPSWSQFGSLHPGIVQFALADGSVRSVATNLNDRWPQRYFQFLSAMADGELVPADATW